MERPRPESLQKALALALRSETQNIRDVHLCAAGDCNVRKRVLEESVDISKLNSVKTLYERLEITLRDWKKMDIYFQEESSLPSSFSRGALLQRAQKLLANSVASLRVCAPNNHALCSQLYVTRRLGAFFFLVTRNINRPS